MSEFKFACPVCGQRMAVESSASGKQVECPTCFQIIIVPKAPVAGSKYQLSATQYIKPVILPPPAKREMSTAPQRKTGLLIFGLILICAALAAMFVRERFVGPQQEHAARGSTNAIPAKVNPLWTLDLAKMTFPEETAGGAIHGKDFVCRRAILDGAFLSLRSNTGRRSEMTANILISTNNFRISAVERFSQKTIEVNTNKTDSVPRVSLSWHEGNLRVTEFFTNDFAMKLEFGTMTSNGLPGKIYLCLPDEMKSCVAGTFIAEIRNFRTRHRP